jgi:hypothetical protein
MNSWKKCAFYVSELKWYFTGIVIEKSSVTHIENSTGILIFCCIRSRSTPAFTHISFLFYLLLNDASRQVFNAMSHE